MRDPRRPYPGAPLHYITYEKGELAEGEQWHIWAGNTRISLLRNKRGVQVLRTRRRKNRSKRP